MTNARILSLFCGAALSAICASQAMAADISFNIPRQPLADALRAFGRQSGASVVIESSDAGRSMSPGVVGAFEPGAALAKILAGSSLTYVPAGTGFMVLKNSASAPKAQFQRVALQAEDVIVSTRQPSSTQEAIGPATTSQTSVEAVVVTGSRVITNSNNSPTPLTTVTTDNLTQTTPANIPDALNKLPQFVASAATRNTHTLNLRGLGAERSLILFNGARVPSTAAGGAINIDTLPQMLIERVDVVTGGTSAVYGSDAITGVVNFIIDRNFNGIKAFAQTGISSPYRDRRSYKYGVAAGGNVFGDKVHLEGSYERFVMDPIKSKLDRPLGVGNYVATGSGTAANPFRATINSRFLTYSPGGYIVIPRTANPAPGALQGDFVFATDGVLSPFNHGATTGSSGLESGGGGGSGTLGDVADTTLTPPTATHQAFGRADFDLGSVHAYLQGSLVTQEEVFNTYPIWFQRDIFVDNPFLPDSVRAGMIANGMTKFTMGKAIHNFPSNTQSSKKRSYSITAGLDGKLADKFTWSGYYTHAQTRDHGGFLDSTDQEKLMVSTDAVRDTSGKIVCRVSTTAAGVARFPGCVPTNLFGPNAVDVGAFDYWSQSTVVDTINKMDDLSGQIVGDVFNGWAGPITMALSGEFRRYSLEIQSPYNSTQLVDCSFTPATICPATLTRWQFGVTNPLPKRTQTVKEAALEVNVPLLKDVPLVQSLDLNLAGRFASYSYSGDAKIWKVGLVWDLNDELKVRATGSRDFRAPSLNDLFRSQSSSQGSTTDLLTGTSGAYRGLSGGNPNLTAETSNTLTLGAVYRPAWAPRLSVALDWYDIKIKQAIGTVSGINPTVQNECINSGGTSPYCAFFVRPFPYSNRTPENFFISVLSQPFNAATSSTKGVDGEINYSTDVPAFLFGDSGKLDTRLLVSYQPKLLSLPLPGAIVTDAAGAAGLAEVRVNLSVTYSTGPLRVSATQRWWSSENQNSDPTLVFDAGKIPSATYTDLSASYRFGDRDGAQPYEAYLSIENVFNRLPDLWLQTGQAGAPGQVFPTPADQDVVGRYVTVGMRARF